MAVMKRYPVTIKELSEASYPCWIKFLHDKYGGLSIESTGYDNAYDQGLIAVVHMQRATAEKIPFGIQYVMPDVWPINMDGRFGVELALTLKSRRRSRNLKVKDVCIKGNSLTIETQESVVTQIYPIDLEKAYTAFLARYGERELMEDDSPMDFEMEEEWKVKFDGSFRGPKRAGDRLPQAP